MNRLHLSDVTLYVEKNINNFHKKRLDNLSSLELNTILKRKNPYLFKAKNVLTAQDIIKSLLDAHLSSQEETIFGEFLEGLAVFVCQNVYNGYKSSAEGIDLEFVKNGIRYIVTVKSGPNWGNSSQIKKMMENFRKAKRILGTNTLKMNIISVNGCCYGKDNKPEKSEYLKLCGQRFWEFISGNENLYIEIIEPLGYKAKEKNDEFLESYSQIINKFTLDFSIKFCDDGKINWEKLVVFNSRR